MQEDQALMVQCRRHAHEVNAVVTHVADDMDTQLIEATDADEIAVRIDRRRTHIEVGQKIDTAQLAVHSDTIAHFGGVRDALEIVDKHVLLTPVLRARVRHGTLAEHKPLPTFDHVGLRERVLYFLEPGFVVILVVEQRTVESANAKQVEVCGRTCNEHEAVFAKPHERLEVGQGVGEVRKLILRVRKPVHARNILGSNEIVAEKDSRQIGTSGQRRSRHNSCGVDFWTPELQVFDEIGTLRDALHRTSEIRTRFPHGAEKLGGGVEGSGIKVCDVVHRMPPLS